MSGADKATNIALIGFMGSGKTTVGRALATHLGWEFVDTDSLIEKKANCSIPDLFRCAGETGFRDQEQEAVGTACAGERLVIATGGGTVMRPANLAALQARAFVVWLTARPEVVVARTERTAASRPVLAAEGGLDDLLTRILVLLGERGPQYQAAAHAIVDTSDRGPQALASEVVRKWEKWQNTGI